MDTLFSLTLTYPEGFQCRANFLSETEEAALLELVKTTTLYHFRFQGYEAKRRVASFGWDWSFEKRELSRGKPIPAEFDWLLQKVGQQLGIAPSAFAELLVTEYPVGSVINFHRDASPFALVAGISLQADCVFKLRPYAKEAQTSKATIILPVKRRSLYVLEGAVREAWQHSISPVKQVRYSVTLRTLKAATAQA